jgi:hypothetical protein
VGGWGGRNGKLGRGGEKSDGGKGGEGLRFFVLYTPSNFSFSDAFWLVAWMCEGVHAECPFIAAE